MLRPSTRLAHYQVLTLIARDDFGRRLVADLQVTPSAVTGSPHTVIPPDQPSPKVVANTQPFQLAKEDKYSLSGKFFCT